MAEQRITITINEDGKISATTEGIKGETCLEELEELLGGLDDCASVKKTDEFYQEAQRKVSRTQKNTKS